MDGKSRHNSLLNWDIFHKFHCQHGFFSILSALLIVAWLGGQPAPEKITVILTEIEGAHYLSDYELIGEVIADGLGKDLDCDLLFGKKLLQALGENNLDLDGCWDANCLGSIGRELNAILVITGKINLKRGNYHFNYSVLNTANQRTVSSRHFEGPADRIEAEIGWKLEKEIKELVGELFGLTTLSIATYPAKASVTLNGTAAGTSPLQLEKLRQGFEYRLGVDKPGYTPFSETYFFSEKHEKLDIRLEELGEALRFSGYPLDSKVYVNKEYIGLIQDLKFSGVAKRYQIKVKKPGYRPYQETVRLKNGESRDIRVFLKRRSKIPPLITSSILPGSGQILHGRWLEGLLFLSASAGAGYLTYLEFLKFDDRYQAYSSAMDRYNNERDLNLIENDINDVEFRFNQMKEQEKQLLQYTSVLGTIWTINLLEILF